MSGNAHSARLDVTAAAICCAAWDHGGKDMHWGRWTEDSERHRSSKGLDEGQGGRRAILSYQDRNCGGLNFQVQASRGLVNVY